LFTGKGVINTEVVRVLLLGVLELVIIKEGIRVGDTKKEPCLTLVCGGGRGVFEEKTANETTVGGNSVPVATMM